MTKIGALIQVVLIAAIVTYATVHLFLGNFEQAIGTMPILFVYYVFVTARHKRAQLREDREIMEE